VLERVRSVRFSSALLGVLVPTVFIMGAGLAADSLKNNRGTAKGTMELMAASLILTWVGVCGTGMFILRHQARRFVQSLPGGWRPKFILGATLLALAEEAITTTLTNLAPVLGSRIGEAFITASTNYLEVVLYNSVIVIVPMFVVWAWLLSRWRFAAGSVTLLFGLNGLIAETLHGGPGALAAAPFWILIYGLMVYLPAYTLPEDREAARPCWYHYLLSLALPILAAAAMAIVVLTLSPRLPHFGPRFGSR
jgi:hypothetical protein